MSRTSSKLQRVRSYFGSTLWGYFWGLAKTDRRTLRRRVVKTVVTSDSAGGLCDHPTQPSLEDCGWGVQLETLVVRQNNDGESGWEVVENYLQADEKVLVVLREWSDLDTLEGEVDKRLAFELDMDDHRRRYSHKYWECRVCGADLRDKPVEVCGACKESLRREAEDDEDDDSFWG
jgi:hypothetical protein